MPPPILLPFLPQLPLAEAKDRNTLIEQSLTLIKHSPTHAEFVIKFMLNFQLKYYLEIDKKFPGGHAPYPQHVLLNSASPS